MPPLAILLPHGTRGHRPNPAERGRGDGPSARSQVLPGPPKASPGRVPGPKSPARPRRPLHRPSWPAERPEPRKQWWRPPGEPVAFFPALLTPSSLSLPLPDAAAAGSSSAMAPHADTAAKRHRVSRRALAPCRKARRRDVRVAMAAGPAGGAGEPVGTEGVPGAARTRTPPSRPRTGLPGAPGQLWSSRGALGSPGWGSRRCHRGPEHL